MEANTAVEPNATIDNATPDATIDNATQVTYTEEQVKSMVSKAINDYAAKSKAKQAKSTDERVAELEAEIARRDLKDNVRDSLKSANIDESLTSLFLGDDYEDRIKTFNTWYESAIEKAVQDKISSATPIHLESPKPSVKKTHTLSELNAKYS